MTEARRGELIKAFIQTFCKYGLDGATTKRLAEEANLSEAGLYVHFKNKEDILLKCVEWHFQNVNSEITIMAQKYESRPDALVLAIFTYIKSMLLENRFIFQVLSHPHYSELVKASRSELIDGVKVQSLMLQKAGLSRETGMAIALLMNSALNNYILTQDEEGFFIQMEFLLRVFRN